MCISGLVRNMNEWKSTGRKKKGMKTSSHSECLQPGQHIFLYLLHDYWIQWWRIMKILSSYMQLYSILIALNWYGLVMSFPAKAFGLVSLHTSWLCVICFSLPMWKCAGCYENTEEMSFFHKGRSLSHILSSDLNANLPEWASKEQDCCKRTCVLWVM